MPTAISVCLSVNLCSLIYIIKIQIYIKIHKLFVIVLINILQHTDIKLLSKKIRYTCNERLLNQITFIALLLLV